MGNWAYSAGDKSAAGFASEEEEGMDFSPEEDSDGSSEEGWLGSLDEGISEEWTTRLIEEACPPQEARSNNAGNKR